MSTLDGDGPCSDCGSTPLDGDDLPAGWVEHRGKHFCPATVNLALARHLNSASQPTKDQP